jgi:hypothetical protein
MPAVRHCCVALLTLTAFACDGRPPSGPIPVYPVNGQVTYQGKPVPGALVVFHGARPAPAPSASPGENDQSGPPTPVGKTDDDGKFKMHTYIGDDGAPVGSYKVTVTLAVGGETRNVMAKVIAKTQTVPLPIKYADPKTTDITADVKEGENSIPTFELKGEPGGTVKSSTGKGNRDPHGRD